MRKQREEKGITLIALIITIIVLLILAGVSIAMLTGENGILKRAEGTQVTQAQAELTEKAKLAIMESLIDTENPHTIDNILKIAVANGYITLEGNAEHILMDILTETEVASITMTTISDLGNNMYVPENCVSVKVVDANIGVWVIIGVIGDEIQVIEGNTVINVAGLRQVEVTCEDGEPDENGNLEITINATLVANPSKDSSKIISIKDKNGDEIEFTEVEGENGDENAIAICQVKQNGKYIFTAEEENGGTATGSIIITDSNQADIEMTSSVDKGDWAKEAVVTIKYDEGFESNENNILQYSLDGSEWIDVVEKDNIIDVVVTENGNIYARYILEDLEIGREVLNIAEIDNTPPVDLELEVEFESESETISIVIKNEATDAQSGVDYYEYIIFDKDEQLLIDWNKEMFYENMTDDKYYIQGKVVDCVGNEYLTDKIGVKSFIEIGDYVNYPVINGYSGSWQVLHLDTSGYIEICSTGKTIAKTFSGRSDYYNLVSLLNSSVTGYLNSTYGVKVRHLGSDPTNPSANAVINAPQLSDNNYYEDYQALVTGNITFEECPYSYIWLASRAPGGYNGYRKNDKTSWWF